MSHEMLRSSQRLADRLCYENLGDLFPSSVKELQATPSFDDPTFDSAGLAPIIKYYQLDPPIFNRLCDLQNELASLGKDENLLIVQEKVTKLNTALRKNQGKDICLVAINRLVPSGEVVNCRNVLKYLNSAIEVFEFQIDSECAENLEIVEVDRREIRRLFVKYRENKDGVWHHGDTKNCRETSFSEAIKSDNYGGALAVLRLKPRYIFVQNAELKTPLVVAAENGKYDFIIKILEPAMEYIDPSDINGKGILESARASSMSKGKLNELKILMQRLKIPVS
ncbi:hypothetical protein D5R81_01760 [Parashewanella spongiae]|uniref:Ankyrin repeat domain-containing protein n=1 Tax=Parashewanella spongiae TaxID=342950 RepID=A0A3A6U5D3_9GAMM|nr:hypothetical protein [Parashewanella spongiae]MCL1076857.1 hypothetical protein [Parashewanella spongiae]RJY19225.1 hypothetical protein D5R81_01760 [Parashewanella spongiae]